MRYIFDIERSVRTFGQYFDDPEQAEVLRELLQSVHGTLERVLPLQAARQIDREGSRLVQRGDRLAVERHPLLDGALRELSELGLFRIFLAEEHGGFGLPVAVYYMAVQVISYHDASLALVFLVHGNAMYVIDRYGSEAQRRRYLPDMAAGRRLASVAFSEPLAGSDAGQIRTRAEQSGDGRWYTLRGSKLWITNGGDADLLVTTARTGPLERDIHGVSTFIVEREADGVEVVGLEDKTGQAGSPTAALEYPGVRIPADRLLGELHHGGQVMFAGVGMTRVNIGAQALGIARRALDAAVDFARERHQGGGPIIEHDAIQHRLADITLIIAAMEHLVVHVSSLEHRGEWHVREMSEAKYYCSERLQELTTRAINVFGGYGVSRDHEVERCRREAVTLPLYGGTSEIQWLIISRELLDSLAGSARVDYRQRDARTADALMARAGGDDRLASLVQRWSAARQLLWRLVEQVAGARDPTPYRRHLTELSVELAACRGLLWQATAADAAELELELARVGLDRLDDRAAHAAGRIEGRQSRTALKRAVRGRLPLP